MGTWILTPRKGLQNQNHLCMNWESNELISLSQGARQHTIPWYLPLFLFHLSSLLVIFLFSFSSPMPFILVYPISLTLAHWEPWGPQKHRLAQGRACSNRAADTLPGERKFRLLHYQKVAHHSNTHQILIGYDSKTMTEIQRWVRCEPE